MAFSLRIDVIVFGDWSFAGGTMAFPWVAANGQTAKIRCATADSLLFMANGPGDALPSAVVRPDETTPARLVAELFLAARCDG